MRLVLLLVATAVVAASVRARRSVEVWHVAPDPDSGFVPGYPPGHDEGP
ncbi:hypothetical protein MPS_2096 [Mycobacterium pseudoshottsii JCM 15466]|nr:hypothetical protein MPS_2096 [Mycobacterium pseudoshottsii JCM 15466]